MSNAYEGWAIVELFGHKRLAGYVSEVEVAGEKMLRVDVPGPEGLTVASPMFGGKAIYCLTPTTEELARAAAQRSPAHEPVTRWELQLPAPTDEDDQEDEDADDVDLEGPIW